MPIITLEDEHDVPLPGEFTPTDSSRLTAASETVTTPPGYVAPSLTEVSTEYYHSTDDSEDGQYYIKSTRIDITAPKLFFDNDLEKFKKYLDDNYPSTGVYQDHRIQLSDVTSEIQSIFNYPAMEYDRFISDLGELEIPNFYLSSDEVYDYEQVLEGRGFNGRVSDLIFKEFDKFGKFRFNYRDSDKIAQFENILFGSDFNFLFFEEFKNVFPFLARVNFTNENETFFYNFLKLLGFYSNFMNDYFDSEKELITFTSTPSRPPGAQSVTSVHESFDMFKWVETWPFGFDDTNKLLINPSYTPLSTNEMVVLKNLIASYLRGLSNTKGRNYEQIVNKEFADHEPVFYKIQKFAGPAEGIPLQTFYLPPGENVIDFYDSQILSDKEYTYKVSGHFLIFGTSYTFDVTNHSESQQTSSNFEARVTVQCVPSFKIVEVPLFTDDVYIVQPPQMVPFVSFHNEMNSQNNIDIFLKLSAGKTKEEFIDIEASDQEQVESLRIYNAGEEFDFAFTSEPGLFEVYRMSTPPKSYGDFSGFKITETRNNVDSTSVIYKDHVTPNQKYYYTFRAINSYGLKSNPTPIYEVELIKDADSCQVKTSVHHIPKQKNYQPTRTFQQLVQIVPAIQHSILDESQASLANADSLSGKISDIQLGSGYPSLWGKSFKIRVRSTTTGKKLDLNLNFKIDKNKTTEDFS